MVSAGPTANNRGIHQSYLYGNSEKGFALNTQYGIQVGFAHFRHESVLLEFTQLTTGMVSKAYTKVINDATMGNEYDFHSLFYNLVSRSAGVGYQFYYRNRGGLAPYGTFVSFYLNWNFTRGEIIDKKTQYKNNSAQKVHSKLGFEPKASYASGGMGFGQNMILADRVLIGYELRANLPFRLFYLNKENILPHQNYYLNNDPAAYNLKEFENDAFKRLIKHNLFYLKAGIGLLLF